MQVFRAIGFFTLTLIIVSMMAVIVRAHTLPTPTRTAALPAVSAHATAAPAIPARSDEPEAPIVLAAVNQSQEPASTPAPQTTQTTQPAPADAGDPPSTFERHMIDREQAAAATTAESIEPAPASAIGAQFNFDVTNAYFYRGINQEDTGVIMQPAAKFTINVHDSDAFKVDAILGTWNSFHTKQTNASTSSSSDFANAWYELDVIAGVVFTRDDVSLSTTYTFLTSPSDAFQSVEELGFTASYDDRDLLGKIALHPYAMLAIETGANGSDGADSDRGTYLELGISPGFTFDIGKTPVSMSFPCSIGLSIDDYYQDAAGEDDLFGFAQVGVKASMPLPFGERYGQWTLNASVAALYLGDHAAQFNHGDHLEFIGTIGVQLNF